MIKTKITELPEVEWIEPRAFLSGRFSPAKLIVELPNGEYAFLLPPLYEVEEVIPQYLFESAVEKNEYQIIIKGGRIANTIQLFDYIELLKKSI